MATFLCVVCTGKKLLRSNFTSRSELSRMDATDPIVVPWYVFAAWERQRVEAMRRQARAR